MSRENVEVVRRVFDAYNKRDLDAALRDTDPDVEMDFSRSRGPDAGIYRGYEGIRRFLRMFDDVFDNVIVTPEDFIERGNHIIIPNIGRGRGRAGIPVEARSVWAVTLRNGRIVRWRLYQERKEALEAVGLEE
jgi:ketosteroid isomerase-like protein